MKHSGVIPQHRRSMMTKNDPILTTGARVQLHPATDAWMSGDRFNVLVQREARG